MRPSQVRRDARQAHGTDPEQLWRIELGPEGVAPGHLKRLGSRSTFRVSQAGQATSFEVTKQNDPHFSCSVLAINKHVCICIV